MKTTIRTLALAAFAAVTLTQVGAAEDPKGDMLEYITPNVFKTELAAGKIKPNTFYWANSVSDQTLVPTSKTDAGGAFLEIRGGGSSAKAKSFLYRLVPIPAGKSAAANVSLDANYEPDLWAATPPQTGERPTVEVYFTDGTRVSGAIPMGIFPGKVNTWGVLKKSYPVPPGAKFIGITATCPASYFARMRNINITFE